MDLLKKILLVGLIFVFVIIISMQFNVLKQEVMREWFLVDMIKSTLSSAGDLEIVIQGDMKSEGGMSNLDNLDGTGTGPMGSGYKTYDLSGATPFPDLSGGQPDGTWLVGPAGGFTSLDGTLNAAGAGLMGSAYDAKNIFVENPPDRTLGVVPVTEPGGDEGYPNQARGMEPYNVPSPRGENGEISKPYTYYYLETDNINVPCKSDKDCGNSKCSESGFCKY